MQIRALRLYQFRNFQSQEISFSPQTNLLFGLNGQGKTNLLEAMYLLAYGKSFRTAIPKECIEHDQTECLVQGLCEHAGIDRELQVCITREEKKLLIHKSAVSLEEFVGTLHVLPFTAEQMKVVRGGPAERRGFLDRAMVTVFPGHFHALAIYGRALRQRNRILRQAVEAGRAPDETLLESWDEKLVDEGARILWNRRRYVEEMRAELPLCLFAGETLKIKYLSKVPEASDSLAGTRAELWRALHSSRNSDLRHGATGVGPHRDELKLFLEGKALADFASAGQQRSSLLALYFAQMEIHKKHHGFYPIVLMDDVDSELDAERLGTMLNYLGERTQIFITTAKQAMLPDLPRPICRFLIDAGTATETTA